MSASWRPHSAKEERRVSLVKTTLQGIFPPSCHLLLLIGTCRCSHGNELFLLPNTSAGGAGLLLPVRQPLLCQGRDTNSRKEKAVRPNVILWGKNERIGEK